MDSMLFATESPSWQLALSGFVSLGVVFFVKSRHRAPSRRAVCNYEQSIPTAIEKLAAVVGTTRHQDHGVCWESAVE